MNFLSAGQQSSALGPLRSLALRLLRWAVLLWLVSPVLAMQAPFPINDEPVPEAVDEPRQAEPAPAEADAGEVAEPSPKISGRAPAFGSLIRVPLPITGNVDNRIKAMIQRAQDRAEFEGGARPVLVLEFVPSGSEFGEGTDFTRALALARYLSSRELAGVKTVAYVPHSIKGHAILVAMACEEIIMARDAELGEAGIDEPAEAAIDPTVLAGYRQIAQRRRTIPVEVALGMLDKRLEVLKVETEVSVEYVLREDLDKLQERRAVQSAQVLIPRGELGHFTGAEGRALGFVKYLAGDRQSVARALDLPPEALREDPSLGGEWKAALVGVEGRMDTQSVSRLQSMIAETLRSGRVNLLIVRIDSAGGPLADSLNLANFLAGLDRSEVRTVAYVPDQARGGAALVALACDQLVMHPQAVLGGLDAEQAALEEADAARESVRGALAPAKGRSWSLLAAFVDPQLRVHRYQNRTSGVVAYFSAEELQEQEDPQDWERGPRVTPAEGTLELAGKEAQRLGLASEVVESFDELKQLFGLQDDPELLEPNWAEHLIAALARPELAFLLLVIGGVAVYAELNSPGVGIGGFIASICFLLFFWSKFLDGTAGWLEVLLFLAGVSFLLLEIFVIPGFGVFGLGGGLLIIASLVLASQTFVFPHDSGEVRQLRDSLLVVGGSMVGIILAALVLRRFLPHAPLFNRMLLEPPRYDFAVETPPARGYDFQHLLGQQGVATTQLTPSGKARFGDEMIDVIASTLVERGAAVKVTRVRGSHVYVAPASAAE